MTRFNLNDIVRVKLTDHGRRALEQDHYRFWSSIKRNPPKYNPPVEDADGWSRWQLWSLMERLGPHMGLGRILVIECNIEFTV